MNNENTDYLYMYKYSSFILKDDGFVHLEDFVDEFVKENNIVELKEIKYRTEVVKEVVKHYIIIVWR